MADPNLSTAIKEAYASVKGGLIFHTIELNHPSFTAPARVVRNNIDLIAKIEETAELNPGENVTFVPCFFDFIPPEVSSGSIPTCTIEIDNVGREILSQIDIAVHSGNQSLTTVIYRAYLSGNELVGPENDPPIKLTISEISVTPFKIKATAGFPNLVNKKFPGIEYTSEVFPGLVQ